MQIYFLCHHMGGHTKLFFLIFFHQTYDDKFTSSINKQSSTERIKSHGSEETNRMKENKQNKKHDKIGKYMGMCEEDRIKLIVIRCYQQLRCHNIKDIRCLHQFLASGQRQNNSQLHPLSAQIVQSVQSDIQYCVVRMLESFNS